LPPTFSCPNADCGMDTPLRSEQDYREALASLERIFATARPGTPEGDEFERLAALIGDYEVQHGPARP